VVPVEEQPGGEQLDAGVLDVPAELGDGPACAAELVRVVDDVVEVGGAARGAVQPERRPEELVVVPADRRVVALHLGDAAVVLASVLVGKLEQLLGVMEEEVGVVRVGRSEGHGGGGQGGGGLAGDVRARAFTVDLVRLPRRGHVLRPLPAVVIGVAVANLGPELVGLGVRLDEVVGAPLDGLERVGELAGGRHVAAVLE